MTRRIGSESDRLTFRGLTPALKRALILRSQRTGRSMEKTVIEILQKDLVAEMSAIKELDEKLEAIR